MNYLAIIEVNIGGRLLDDVRVVKFYPADCSCAVEHLNISLSKRYHEARFTVMDFSGKIWSIDLNEFFDLKSKYCILGEVSFWSFYVFPMQLISLFNKVDLTDNFVSSVEMSLLPTSYAGATFTLLFDIRGSELIISGDEYDYCSTKVCIKSGVSEEDFLRDFVKYCMIFRIECKRKKGLCL